MVKTEKAYIQVYMCLVIALFAWKSIDTVRFPFGADYGEAPLVDQARRIQDLSPLYKADLNQPPYVISNYPPLYPAFVAVLNFVSRIPLFQAGRITSIMFALISGYIIGLFTNRLTGKRWFGVFSAALFLGQPYVLFWSSLARVDLMALAFSLRGLWIRFRYKATLPSLILGGLCFLCSAFTRQTYLLAGPLAGFAWLWCIDRKKALVFIISLSAAGLAIFGTINALTQGGFYINIVMSNINQYSLAHTLSTSAQLFLLWPVVLFATLILVILTIFSRFAPSPTEQIGLLRQPFVYSGLLFYTLGGLFSAFTIGKIGSNVNYLLELMSACAIWCGLGLGMIIHHKKTVQWAIFCLVAIQTIWVLANGYGLARMTSLDLWGKQPNSANLQEKVQTAVKDGVVLSDDYMDLIVLSDQAVYYQPFEYGELYNAGMWDPDALVSQIEKSEFPLIIIGGTTLYKDCCWPMPVINALEANYQIDKEPDALLLTPMK
ncbi:MAG: hypothetical protein FIA98_09485 [Anaerolineae bacterium]|nr:hypothetical protein [Anaerolineae bacterium]